MIEIFPYSERYAEAANAIWNTVVEEGNAFPQTDTLNREDGRAFFESQTFTGIAVDRDSGEAVGLYILHPNNLGHCGHLCNASYAVRKDLRGRGIGAALVTDCIKRAKALGFGVLQFNAVVATNTAALALYKKLGFTRLGVIPKGFRLKSGEYEDIIPHYISL